MTYRRPLTSGNGPNEAGSSGPLHHHHRSPEEHPDDEMDPVVTPFPPSIHRTSHHHQQTQQRGGPMAQQQQQQQQPPSPLPALLSQQQSGASHHHHHHHHHTGATSSLASKPHAFGGAVLSPDHARNLTTDLALQLASALSVQASHAASSRGVLPPGEIVNLFKGSDLVDILTGWRQQGDGNGGRGAGVFRRASLTSTTSNTTTPGTPKANATAAAAPHILQLLHHGGAPSPNPKSTPGASTPGTSATASSASNAVLAGGLNSTSPANTPIDAASSVAASSVAASAHPVVNPLSLLSTAEAVESFAAWRTHYTVWITEAWHILKWSEPSAALFWEMATMFHTLYVASLSNGGGGSGSAVRGRVLGVSGTPSEPGDAAGAGEGSGVAASGALLKTSTATAATAAIAPSSGNYIPPLLSCGSQSSMGSVRSAGTAGQSFSDAGEQRKEGSQGQCSHGGGAHNGVQSPNPRSGAIKTARHSAKELPVWLISMFLLVHCEAEAFLRCTSGEDERRYGDPSVPSPQGGGDGAEGSLDFSALLHHRSLSPRTRLHAGTHQNNANCASFVLRHLRKFLLLCAVPRNVAACKSVATLAAKGGGVRSAGRTVGGAQCIDIAQIDSQHQKEHGSIGLSVELTVEELDRLHLVLQAPSGGLVEDPPIAIGEHILKCLAVEEMEGSAKGAPTSHRWNLMQNGLITVADAERILRRYLEEELTMAKHELDGEDDLRSSVTGVEDVAAKLSKMSMGSGETRGPSAQPLSPSRRGVSHGDTSDADAAKDSSYLKELSYHRLSSTTVLLEPGKDTHHGTNGPEDSDVAGDSQSQTSRSSGGRGEEGGHPAQHPSAADAAVGGEANGRLHDLHVADCSDTHFYLLQPFEHATIAACTDCTIVLGAVAGLLHVVDCERTTITSAARRVVVSNSFDVVHYLFTPSPPLLVGDNRGCQFAPYNTYYEGLREDLLATGLAAVLRSAGAARDSNSSGSVCGGDGNTTASPGRGGSASPTGSLPTLQCASNKWKVPVELCKLEVPQLPHVPTPGSPGPLDAPSSPGADDRALGGNVDVAMKTPVLLPSSEFDVLLVPVESEEARIRRQLLRESQEESAATAAIANNNNEEETLAPSDVGENEAAETATAYSGASTLTGVTERPSEQPPPLESDYCRILADLLTLSPFHMPHDYERRVMAKAERVRTLREAIVQELNEEGRSSLEEELNRGFQDWLVTSGNLRQVIDLIHLEKRVSVA